MRKNLPVFEFEYPVSEDVVLVSRTDLNGVITYCNKAFCEVSGFTENELLGEPHNIVRHPDVPQRVFADCWETISLGKLWHGVIKNRRKNGDYYWIDANISPLLENDEIVGYISLRYKASAAQIARAEKYYRSVHEGKLFPVFSSKPDKNYIANLQQRLAEKLRAQEDYLESHEQEQRVASRYMNKLIALDKLRDSSVQFYLKPAANFSGDILAIARTPDNRLHLMLADSTGHGLSAALAAMPMIHPFYSMTGKGFTISAIAKEINSKVWQSLPISHFVAAILVSIDTASQMVEVWSGGSPPPLVLNERGECVYQFKPRHLAMGILSPAEFDHSVEYFSFDNHGYSLMMFSDGVIEMENTQGKQFGLQRLLEATRHSDADARWQNILRSIESYGGKGSSSADDIALMVASFKFPGKKPSTRKVVNGAQEQTANEGAIVWQFALTLAMHQLRKLDVVPLLLDIVQQIEKDKERGGEIFMILSEMFNNALDHGVLKLDSALKHHEDGLEKYFDERTARLANVETGEIQLRIKKILHKSSNPVLRIRIKDSGEGFDYSKIADNAASATQFHGRGITLLYNVCRKVEFLGNGSEVMVELDLPDEKP